MSTNHFITCCELPEIAESISDFETTTLYIPIIENTILIIIENIKQGIADFELSNIHFTCINSSLLNLLFLNLVYLS